MDLGIQLGLALHSGTEESFDPEELLKQVLYAHVQLIRMMIFELCWFWYDSVHSIPAQFLYTVISYSFI